MQQFSHRRIFEDDSLTSGCVLLFDFLEFHHSPRIEALPNSTGVGLHFIRQYASGSTTLKKCFLL